MSGRHRGRAIPIVVLPDGTEHVLCSVIDGQALLEPGPGGGKVGWVTLPAEVAERLAKGATHFAAAGWTVSR